MAISYKTVLITSAAVALTLVTQAASALSSGCSGWNTSATSDGVLASNQAFSQWEVATVSFTHISGTSPNNYTYTYTDNIDAGNSLPVKSGSTVIGETVTLSLQIPNDTTSGRLLMHGPGAQYNITVTCVAGAAPVAPTPESVSSASTTPTVIAAISRSQTSIIQKNIKSRVSSVISAASRSAVGGVAGVEASTIAPLNISHIHNENAGLSSGFEFSDHDANSITDSSDALRRFAMMGSFDSSTGNGLAALGLGPADRGSVGGAGGVDARSGLYSDSPFTVWGHGSFTSVDNDYVSGTTDNRYDGDVWGYNIGLDYRFTETLTAGVTMGYNDTDLTTAFNQGRYKEQGWVISPYAIYRPLQGLAIVAEFGFGQGDIDVTRNNDTVTGSTDSDLWYGSLTSTYTARPVETLPFSLTSSVAFVAARKTVEGYTESDGRFVEGTHVDTQQINPAIEVAYEFAPTGSLIVTPFFSTELIYDFTDTINDDKAAFNIGGGVRLSDRATGLNAALEANYLAGRSDYTEYTISGTLAYGFAISNDEGRPLGFVKPFFGSQLDEYGIYRLRGGFGYSFGDLNGELAMSHMVSEADDDNDNYRDTSSIVLSLSMPL